MSVNEPLQPNYNFAWVKADNTRLTKEELHNQRRQDMSEKPEALEAAESLEQAIQFYSAGLENSDNHMTLLAWAAEKFRRLHAENERLRDELKEDTGVIAVWRGRTERAESENERLREALTYDWDQLEACRESLREHMVEIKRLRELLTEARGAKWLVVQDNLLDRIDAALRREPGDG